MREEKAWLLRVVWVSNMTEKAMPEKRLLMMLTRLVDARAEHLMRGDKRG